MKTLLLISYLLISFSCFCQKVSHIDISYVDPNTDFAYTISNTEFESTFKEEIKTKKISDKKDIAQIIFELNNLRIFKPCTSLDIRIKMEIWNDNKLLSEVYIDRFFVLKNGMTFNLSKSLKKIIYREIGFPIK
ncbi:hypothetical protein [Coprobacter fastidiosus]|uniref:DUF4468 domain-containing protein n=1 Tax=Coprobacter fastidiosus NSB1 = JCM 33896 TaxID=1349822 RepID=A0A495WIF2_9BACT|nr:hypothetical protein [Coprobacter fastidiosus]ERM89553.1 hypothetical protein NSB1T_08455 [Coprobacter fastidiosus NSB1 = JCM 33896]RKT61060.1 hypothetical protein BC742_0099 [Coprobacter fastidiosus NSB1 = JCM 33896]BEG61133.1 hypothetical protein Cfast33896_00880 [Coprobacter fastidiosus]